MHYPIRKFAKNEETINAINKLQALNIENIQSLPNDNGVLLLTLQKRWIYDEKQYYSH
ncbi:hypothetical protein JCM10003_2600 [Bacteroides pyogenes JCM 10003]|nr:hypothetical protein JCM10003_2600 [Bacteroides pyogenes JCM 10003]